MLIDWESKKTEIFLNPRMVDDERAKISKSLSEISDFTAHVWVATSGTTGPMKFVALSKQALLVSAESINKHIDSNEKDIWLHTLPDFHVGGIGIWARSYLTKAKVVKYFDKWDPNKFISLAKNSKATITSLVPTQVYDLLQLNLKSPESLRAIFVGGGAISVELYDRATDLGWKIFPTYGLTECSSQVATGLVNDPNLHPLDHVQVRVDDQKNIFINSSALFTCYAYFEKEKIKLHNPKKCGWFKTDDQGEINNNVLNVFGRATNYIKIGGEGVNLQHLQTVWEGICLKEELEGDTALIASKDDRLGHSIHLLVQGNNLKIQKQVDQYNKEVLPFAKIRKVIKVEKIPRNVMGKIS